MLQGWAKTSYVQPLASNCEMSNGKHKLAVHQAASYLNVAFQGCFCFGWDQKGHHLWVQWAKPRPPLQLPETFLQRVLRAIQVARACKFLLVCPLLSEPGKTQRFMGACAQMELKPSGCLDSTWTESLNRASFQRPRRPLASPGLQDGIEASGGGCQAEPIGAEGAALVFCVGPGLPFVSSLKCRLHEWKLAAETKYSDMCCF